MNMSTQPFTNGSSGPAVQMTNGTSHHYASEAGDGVVSTEFLVVGAGPAGASVACFLTSYGEFSRPSQQDAN